MNSLSLTFAAGVIFAHCIALLVILDLLVRKIPPAMISVLALRICKYAGIFTIILCCVSITVAAYSYSYYLLTHIS
jgi:hypothetical protein